MPSDSPSKRRKATSLPRLFFTVMAISLLVSFFGVLTVVFGLASDVMVYALMGLVVGLVTIWMAWRWWMAVDEGVREAHKTSWYWGGSAGLVVVGMLALPLVPIAQGDVVRLGMRPSEAGFMLAGIAFTVTVLLLGYVLCWAGWWFTRGR